MLDGAVKVRATMIRKSSNCAICDSSNLASVCALCVNYRLSEYYASLRSLKNTREALRLRLEEQFKQKSRAEEQVNWRALQNEKLARLRMRLHQLEKQLLEGKVKKDRESNDLKVKQEMLDSASSMLRRKQAELEKLFPNLIHTQSLGFMAIISELIHKQSVVLKQICKLFPLRQVNSGLEKTGDARDSYDQICNARLPKGLDPHSVPSEELAASLGYMLQLLNLAIPILATPSLHNSGFAGSCSRIWQRNSYWDARPLSRSHEYPLFIARQNLCSLNGENSWSDRSSSNFGVASVDSERKPSPDGGSASFNYSSASPHSVETHKELQKGISLLKKSVACITTHRYNSLCLDVPIDMSTFATFGKLLAILSSSKEVRSVLSLKMACSRSIKQVSKTEVKSAHHTKSIALANSSQVPPMASILGGNLSDSNASFLFATGGIFSGKTENDVDDWDIVEHPNFPPPPSQIEDVEHWARAMFIDAKRR